MSAGDNSAAWWETSFARRVRKYGISQLAAELQVEDAAIYQWISGRTIPHPNRALRIVSLIRGLSLEQIYEHRMIVKATGSTSASETIDSKTGGSIDANQL